MKGQFTIWLLFVGLLIIGLAAPFVALTSEAVAPLYSDTATMIVIWTMLPVFTIIFVYFMLFADR